MSEYRFITRWTLDHGIDLIWYELTHPESWPVWWKYVRKTDQVKEGNDQGVGSVWRYNWSSRLPYSLTFDIETVKVNKPYYIEGVAIGDLQGIGKWFLEEVGGQTNVSYEWLVETNKLWMKLLAPLARPIFEWNHDEVMKQGGIGLNNYLYYKYG